MSPQDVQHQEFGPFGKFDDPLPPEPPPVPDHITHLWLAPDSSKRVLIWSHPDGWRNFLPYN
jgi:hypothetical protein